MLLPPTTPAGPVTGTAVQVWPPSVLLNRGRGSVPCVASPPATTVPLAAALLGGRTVRALMRTWGKPTLDHAPPSRLPRIPSSPPARAVPLRNANARTVLASVPGCVCQLGPVSTERQMPPPRVPASSVPDRAGSKARARPARPELFRTCLQEVPPSGLR